MTGHGDSKTVDYKHPASRTPIDKIKTCPECQDPLTFHKSVDCNTAWWIDYIGTCGACKIHIYGADTGW